MISETDMLILESAPNREDPTSDMMGRDTPPSSKRNASFFALGIVALLLVLLLGGVLYERSTVAAPGPKGIATKSWLDRTTSSNASVELLGAEASQEQEGKKTCISMCVGVFSITCMANGNAALDFRDGIFDGLVVSLPNSEGGIVYYMLSIGSEYLGANYLEYGTYKLNETPSIPTATQNCGGRLDFYALDDKDEFASMSLDLEWNGIDDSFLLFSQTGFGCHYQRIYGNSCRQATVDIVKAYGDYNLEIPDHSSTCS